MTDEAPAGPDQPAGPAHCRGFRLSDAMVLVAGAALALAGGAHLLVLLADALVRLCGAAAAHRDDLPEHWPVFWAATRGDRRNPLWSGFQVAGTALLGLTPAFLVLRLRRPRPPLRALLRQPGAVAGLAMVLGLLWGTGLLLSLFPERVDSMTAAPA